MTNGADKIRAVRRAIAAALSQRQICRRFRISPTAYFRIEAAMVSQNTATASSRVRAPRLTAIQTERLCRCFSGLPIHEQARVAEEVRQSAQATLYSSVHPRMNSAVIELMNAIAQARATPARSIVLSRRAWALVGGDPSAEDHVLPRRKGRLGVLLAGLQRAHDDVEAAGGKRGGHQADSRQRAFVANLGVIYEDTAKKEPTCTVDPESGELCSPFGRFVSEAFLDFAPEGETPIDTVQTLVQRLARFRSNSKRGPRRRTAG